MTMPAEIPPHIYLYGSNTLTSLSATTFTLAGDGFTQVSSGTLTLPNTGVNLPANTGNEGRGNPASISFANTQAYTSYILVFPTVRDGAGTNSMQIAEARLTGTALVPEPASAAFLGLASLGLVLRRRR